MIAGKPQKAGNWFDPLKKRCIEKCIRHLRMVPQKWKAISAQKEKKILMSEKKLRNYNLCPTLLHKVTSFKKASTLTSQGKEVYLFV